MNIAWKCSPICFEQVCLAWHLSWHPAAAVEEVFLAGMAVVGDETKDNISKKNELFYLSLSFKFGQYTLGKDCHFQLPVP